MAGAGDMLAICLLAAVVLAGTWLRNHPCWGTDRTMSVREPRSHVHVLREWDEQ